MVWAILQQIKRPVETSKSVMPTKSVSEPLQTGLKAIDTLVPIGRGREAGIDH